MTAPLVDAATSRRLTALRSLLMLAVVCIHTEKGLLFALAAEAPLAKAVLNVFCRHVFQTAVPLYFAMSGYLLFLRYDGGLGGYPGLIVKRFRTIMLPFLLANLFWVVFILVEGGIPGIGGTTYVKERGFVGLIFGLNGLPLIYPLWFLRDLFILFLLAPGISFVIRRLPYLGLAGFWLCWNFMLQEGIPLEFSGAFFFYLGGLLAEKRTDLDGLRPYIWPVCLGWIGLVAVSSTIQISGTETIWRYPAWRASVLVGAVAVWLLSGKVHWGGNDGKDERGETNWKRAIFLLSPYIFFIYLLHEPALSFIASWTSWMVSPDSSPAQLGYVLFLAVATMAATLGVAWMLKRFAPPVYSLLTGGR
ncbi:MAG: acyltransferase [Desulfovibrio sp.]|nr:acyltransferase [Desulfovibrio sp.]MBI4961174.1 acyltransferase [Desulfovibrio sp.]